MSKFHMSSVTNIQCKYTKPWTNMNIPHKWHFLITHSLIRKYLYLDSIYKYSVLMHPVWNRPSHHCFCWFLGTKQARSHDVNEWRQRSLVHYFITEEQIEAETKLPYFADNIFECIFINENCCILIKISLKNFVSIGPINNYLSLVQIMAWCQTGDKPLSETMMA